MQDDNLTRNEEEVVDNTNYIDAIKDLKQNSVSKEKYDALVAENKKLVDALVNGEEIETEQEEELKPRLDYYKAYKENKFNTDLEYWTNFLNLREATIKEYGKDPCVTGNYGLSPEGERVEPAYGEQETIDQQLGVIKDMIAEADGDPTVFSTLMQAAMKKR